jgi:hypothetical protein
VCSSIFGFGLDARRLAGPHVLAERARLREQVEGLDAARPRSRQRD